MKIIFILCLSIFLNGCETLITVSKMGPDTYRISTSKEPIFGGAPAAEREALLKANQHCESLGKEILVTSTSILFERPVYNFTVNFQCFTAGDKRLQPPTFKSKPDFIIEQRIN
jgi:hypothetical protein